MNDFQDIELVCACGKEFIWSIGEQEFINDLYNKGKIEKVNQPKRCVSCRRKNKEERERREQNEGRNY